MSGKYTIKLKRRSQPRWILWMVLLVPFFLGLLNELLGIPWAIRYVLDVAWGMLLVYMGLTKRKGPSLLIGWVLLFLIYTLLVYLIQFQAPQYYLWGVRNLFRFYVVFLAVAVFWKSEDVEDSMNLLDKLFWADVIVSLYQFLILGLSGDHLGGIFSTEAGGNGYTNLFFLIIVTKSIVFCVDKQERLWISMAKCAAALVVAAMAELKFFFLEFLIVVILALVFRKVTVRKMLILAGGIGAVILGISLLEMLFPESIGWFSAKRIWTSAFSEQGYTSGGDLNRLNAIPQINGLWLKNVWLKLFGLGLGNCDTSQFAFLNTPFYECHGHMHYLWRSYAAIYLETGWVGLLFYWGFFLLVFVQAWKMERRTKGTAKSCCRISKIMALLCLLISLYNASLRGEAGYMACFVMAMPFAMEHRDRREL